MPSTEVVISSGNILSKTASFGRGSDVATGELLETLKSCVLENPPNKELFSGSTNGLPSSTSNGNAIFEIKGNDGAVTDKGTEERDELKVSFKIFLYSFEEEEIIEAIQRALKKTGTTFVDSVVLSFATPLTCEKLESTWIILEKQVEAGTIRMIGLSDVETEHFINLYTKSKVKPTVIQINLASCCVVPLPLQEFCKQNNIQLLTHSDPLDILPAEKLDELNVLFNVGDTKSKLEVKGVLRYQVHSKCRGVISNKGYIASFVYNSSSEAEN